MTHASLSHGQRRALVSQELHPDSAVSNIGGIVRIHGPVDVARLEQSIEAAQSEFEAFRLSIEVEERDTFQKLNTSPTGVIQTVDLSNLSLSKDDTFDAWAEAEFRTPLKEGEYHHFCVFKTKDGGGYVVRMHHVFTDGWAMSLLTSFIERAYQSETPKDYRENGPSYLSVLERRTDYFSSDRCARDKEYWSGRLAQHKQSLPVSAGAIGGQGVRTVFTLSDAQSECFRSCASRLDLSLNQLLLLLHAVYLGHRDGANTGVIGCPLMDRRSRSERQTFGMMTTHIPFTWTLDPSESFEELAKRIKLDFGNAIRHGQMPPECMQDSIPVDKRHTGPLFDSCINYYAFGHNADFAGFPQSVEDFYTGCQTFRYQIVLRENRDTDVIQLVYDDAPAQETRAEIKALHAGLMSLAEQANDNPGMTLSSARVLSAEQLAARRQLMTGPSRHFSPTADVVEALRHFARTTPDAIALRTDKDVISYRQLEQHVEAIVQDLHDAGLGEGATVGILVQRSPHTVAALLAVLWLGGRFVPLNHAFPIDRLGHMCAKAKVDAILHDPGGATLALKLTDICIPAGLNRLKARSNPVPSPVRGKSAYVLFTSGSTGLPKGVEISRDNLDNYLQFSSSAYYTADDCSAFYTPITFDLTITAVLSPISAGASIRIYDETLSVADIFEDIVSEARVTTLKITPSHLKILTMIEEGQSALRRLVVGGEDLRQSLASRCVDRFPNSIIYNEYGPTEATVGCMISVFDPKGQTESVPIGAPIDNMQVHIRTPWGSDAPVGAIGEIVLEGASVALGYVDEPELTSAKFSQADHMRGARMYRTGDLAKFHAEESLVYLGRRDRQIKLLGNRIELDEVETAASNCPGVTQAATVVLLDHNGEPNALAVAFTPSSIEIETVRACLEAALPSQMIPHVFVGLDCLPLTKNGKVDTERLAKELAPNVQSTSSMEESELQVQVREAIEEILNVKGIGADENLFLYGLDSIKSLRIAAKLQPFGMTSPDILKLASLRGIAVKCCSQAQVVDDIPLGSLPLRLTPAAQWFLSWNAPRLDRYAQFAIVNLKEPTSMERVAGAVAKLTENHEALRQIIDQPSDQVGHKFRATSNVPIVALGEDQTLENAVAAVTSSIDLASGCLVALGSYGATSTRFLLAVHHLAVDAYSWLLLLQELDAILSGTVASSVPSMSGEASNRGAYLEKVARDLPRAQIEDWHRLVSATGPAFQKQISCPSEQPFTQMSRKIALNGVALEGLARDLFGLNAETLTISVILKALSHWTTTASCQIELERTGRTEIAGVPSNLNEVGWFSALFPIAPPSFMGSWDQCFRDVISHLAELPTAPELFGALQQLMPEKFKYHPQVRLNPLGSSVGVDLEKLTVDARDCGLHNGTGMHSQCAAELDVAWTSTEVLLHLRADPFEISIENQELILERVVSAFKEVHLHISQRGGREANILDFDAVDLSEDELVLLLDAASELREVERNEA
ncbi:Dimodular nonribosomal peptide synthase [Pseudovibrio sp. Ad46]|uniref:amino acid adenylation domain-containing protein n=1 Tax=Pseudovibrio sp. Ad46 TaxID=989432 RepID=UPI0007B2A379|nr:amino acid adenylation domain-containing protein [Pseudovibrio sp. Ad46]KZK81608.1 Dimodular nonribosomal peptide synthase [Pseudovibrio sp. Ad46]